MTKKDITDTNKYDFENFLDVYKDKRDHYAYNLNVTLNISSDSYLVKKIDHETQWSILAWELYGSPRLAWLLMKINNVQPEDMFKLIQPGDVIAYLSDEDVRTILMSTNNL